MTYRFQVPTEITFGLDAVKHIGEKAKKLGGKTVLIVTGETIERIGLIDKVKNSLDKKGFEIDVFNKVSPDPSLEAANLITQIVRKKKYDLIVGLGGGSNMDMAKVASIMATNPGNIREYIGEDLVLKPGLPKILVPTTAGSGSEVSRGLSLDLMEEKPPIKKRVGSIYNFPEIAIVDPLMTTTMPAILTANSGIDALAHAIESFLSLNSNPLTDAISLEAIRLIASNLPIAFAQGNNIKARSNMAMAATMAMIGCANSSTIISHAMTDTFPVKYKVVHGEAIAIVLPHVLEFNMIGCVPKYVALVEAMGEESEKVLSSREVATKAVSAVKRLIQDLGMKRGLKDAGVQKEDIPIFAKSCMKDLRRLAANPRKLTKEDCIMLFEKMWEDSC